MALKEWCGSTCADCSGCSLDEQIPCSPDCKRLTERGTILVKKCLADGCEEIKYIFDMAKASDEEIIDKFGEEAAYPYSYDNQILKKQTV